MGRWIRNIDDPLLMEPERSGGPEGAHLSFPSVSLCLRGAKVLSFGFALPKNRIAGPGRLIQSGRHYQAGQLIGFDRRILRGFPIAFQTNELTCLIMSA